MNCVGKDTVTEKLFTIVAIKTNESEKILC